MGKIFAAAAVIVGAVALIIVISLFEAYIALDIAKLFEVPFLSSLPYIQFYGLVVVAKMTMRKKGDFKLKEDHEDTEDALGSVIGGVIGSVIAWGLFYVIHHIIVHYQ